MRERRITLREHLFRQDGLDTDLIFLLEDIAASCRIISHMVRQGPFAGTLGDAGNVNVQGEEQKELDVLANDVFVRHCSVNKRIAALVSEEAEEAMWLKRSPAPGDYILYFDPLDGSSNLALNMCVGSIFSVVRLTDAIDPSDPSVLLRPGQEQICAGYAIYGPATSLVLTTGASVDIFTHQRGTGEFRLTQSDVRIDEDTAEFAINASRYHLWDPPVRRYFDECLQGKTGPRGKTFNTRWIASMVAEVHRILTRGGVFLYPCDAGTRAQGGRLRLMYEANPMAMLIEAAGGQASTGFERILDIRPTAHHQRVPVILGSSAEVALIDRYHGEDGGSSDGE